jgi:hypothetical protein
MANSIEARETSKHNNPIVHLSHSCSQEVKMQLINRGNTYDYDPSKSTGQPFQSDLQKANNLKEYYDLELIPTEQSDRPVSKVRSILALVENLWQKAITALTKEPEIHEWQGKDGYDHIHWHEYDAWTSECFLRDRFFRDQLNNLNH